MIHMHWVLSAITKRVLCEFVAVHSRIASDRVECHAEISVHIGLLLTGVFALKSMGGVFALKWMGGIFGTEVNGTQFCIEVNGRQLWRERETKLHLYWNCTEWHCDFNTQRCEPRSQDAISSRHSDLAPGICWALFSGIPCDLCSSSCIYCIIVRWLSVL